MQTPTPSNGAELPHLVQLSHSGSLVIFCPFRRAGGIADIEIMTNRATLVKLINKIIYQAIDTPTRSQTTPPTITQQRHPTTVKAELSARHSRGAVGVSN
jgi:hypothetical protein